MRKLKDAEKAEDDPIMNDQDDPVKEMSEAEVVATSSSNRIEKRKSTEELINQLTVPSKRRLSEETKTKDFQTNVENCCIGMFHVLFLFWNFATYRLKF